MRIVPAFILLSPIAAIRVSDSVAIGAYDAIWILLAIFALKRARNINESYIAFLSTAYLIFAACAVLLGFARYGLQISDIPVFRIFSIQIPLIYATTRKVTADQLTTYARLFMISGAIAILTGIGLYHLGVQIQDSQQVLWAASGSSLRAGGILGNSGDYGHLAAAWGAICGLLSLVLFRKRWFWFAIVAGLGLYATWISASRAALLHLLLTYAIGVPLIIGATRSLALLTSTALAGILFTLSTSRLVFDASTGIGHTLLRFDIFNLSGQSKFFSTSRFINWANALEAWTSDMWFGIGYRQIQRQLGTPGDNSFLTALVEYGLFAGIAYALIWIALLISGIRLSAKNHLGSVLLACVVGEIAHAMTVDTITIWYSTPIALFFIGAILRCADQMPSRSTHTSTPERRDPDRAPDQATTLAPIG